MSERQNTDRSDLVESTANEAKRLIMSQDIEKQRQYASVIAAAQAELTRMKEQRQEYHERQDRRRKQIVYETAQKLEELGMPIEFIVNAVVKGLEGYDISGSTIRRILKKTKYTLEEDFEESTVENLSVTKMTITIHQDNLL
jgi:hypothetical protein